jgi:hypothetical protein
VPCGFPLFVLPVDLIKINHYDINISISMRSQEE